MKERIKNILAYRKPSWRLTAVYMALIVTVSAGCIAEPTPSLLRSQPLYHGYYIDKLIENKTPYVGNHVKVAGLLNGMPKPVGLDFHSMELQTKVQPYGLIIHYKRNDATEMASLGAAEREALYRNSVLLFTLIGNVDHITHSIEEEPVGAGDTARSVTYTRDQAQQPFIEKDYPHTADEAGLRELIDRLEDGD